MSSLDTLNNSVIVHIDRFSLSRDLQLEALEEFKALCLSSGTNICGEINGKIDKARTLKEYDLILIFILK